MEILCSDYAELASGVLLLVFLVAMSVQDWRRRAIGIRLPCVMAAAGAAWLAGRACAEGTTVEKLVLELGLALLPGIFFWLVAAATGQMGYGDGLVVAVVGLWCGLWKCLFAVGISFFLMALFAAGMLILHRANRRTRVPYVPFLTLSYLVQMGLRIQTEMG